MDIIDNIHHGIMQKRKLIWIMTKLMYYKENEYRKSIIPIVCQTIKNHCGVKLKVNLEADVSYTCALYSSFLLFHSHLFNTMFLLLVFRFFFFRKERARAQLLSRWDLVFRGRPPRCEAAIRCSAYFSENHSLQPYIREREREGKVTGILQQWATCQHARPSEKEKEIKHDT